MRVRIEFKPRDLWVGVYSRQRWTLRGRRRHDVWVCLVPMLPVHVWWFRSQNGGSAT